MNNVTFRRTANYLSVDNAEGNEIGGIYSGVSGNSFNLVMFKQDRGNFETLERAMREAAKIAKKKHNVIFQDSIEATQFLEKLQAMVNDPRLADWCASSDYNFDSKTCGKLAEASVAIAKLVDALDNAC